MAFGHGIATPRSSSKYLCISQLHKAVIARRSLNLPLTDHLQSQRYTRDRRQTARIILSSSSLKPQDNLGPSVTRRSFKQYTMLLTSSNQPICDAKIGIYFKNRCTIWIPRLESLPLQVIKHNLISDVLLTKETLSDTISYTCLIMGVMNLGYTAFPISTRNSPAAVAHLLSKTGVLQLFVSPDPAMQRLSREALDILARDGHKVEVLPVPQFEDLFLGGNNGKQAPPVARTEKLKADGQALILHSSGK